MLNRDPINPRDPALALLSERARYVVEQRLTRTLADIANEFGVTAVRVRQIEQNSLRKLRGPKAQKLRTEQH